VISCRVLAGSSPTLDSLPMESGTVVPATQAEVEGQEKPEMTRN